MNSLKLRLGLFAALYSIDALYQWLLNDLDVFPLNYFYAAIVGGITVGILFMFGSSKIVKDIQIIHIIWVGVHAVGFIMYMCYLPPDVYNGSQYVLHIVQLLWLIFARHDIQRLRLYHDRSNRVSNDHTRMYRSNFEG